MRRFIPALAVIALVATVSAFGRVWADSAVQVGYIGYYAMNWPMYSADEAERSSKFEKVQFIQFENVNDLVESFKRGRIVGVVGINIELALDVLAPITPIVIHSTIINKIPYRLVVHDATERKNKNARKSFGYTPWASAQEEHLLEWLRMRHSWDVGRGDLVLVPTRGSSDKLDQIVHGGIDGAFILTDLIHLSQNKLLGAQETDIKVFDVAQDYGEFPFSITIFNSSWARGRAGKAGMEAVSQVMDASLRWLKQSDNRESATILLENRTGLTDQIVLQLYEEYIKGGIFAWDMLANCEILHRVINNASIVKLLDSRNNIEISPTLCK